MSRVRRFFVREAEECLAALRQQLARERPDAGAAHAAARRLRGSAQMARFGAIAETAGALERRLRPGPDRGAGEAPFAEMGAVLESLEKEVQAVRDGRRDEDPRMEAGMDERDAVETGGGEDIMPIEALEYRGEAALERALALREALENAIVAEEPAGPVLDELFDLIRLGAK